MDVKHGGCHDCKTMNVPMLYSMPIYGVLASKAVCPGCWEQHHKGQKIVEK